MKPIKIDPDNPKEDDFAALMNSDIIKVPGIQTLSEAHRERQRAALLKILPEWGTRPKYWLDKIIDAVENPEQPDPVPNCDDCWVRSECAGLIDGNCFGEYRPENP